MGGNALASYGAKRVSKEVAGLMLQGLLERLASLSAEIGLVFRLQPIQSYRMKPDFGDLDLLVENKLFKELTSEQLVAKLASTYQGSMPWVKSGPVLSIGLPLEGGGCLQADLISTPCESFDFSAGYFSWNDLGNLVGRVAHKMGLKFGHDGLWLPMRDGTHLFDEILITRDFKAALHFLGFDANIWESGFDSLEQIYSFVANGSRFSPELYPLENRNHIARVRDRKRPVYMGFLSWLGERQDLKVFEWRSDKSFYLSDVFRSFPASKGAYEASVHELTKSQALKERFNGRVVTAITGLSGKELGHFMGRFKTEYANVINQLETISDDELARVIRAASEA
ncbi:hypothetical protein HBO23_32150 [Pseudomonas sp. WS 5532]|uniref:hypothetical protein n=1 Tax=Pseudomonas sp. WS 5532 TaxID=2717495 RepID=UPI00147401CF|nr:hypothetical protein [Pseudomonas sp. WS 5532]NMX77620.1 hypothetical protein [Pseudomonas sp. WS 5532]